MEEMSLRITGNASAVQKIVSFSITTTYRPRRTFKDTNLSLLDGLIKIPHKVLLDRVRIVGKLEVLHIGRCQKRRLFQCRGVVLVH